MSPDGGGDGAPAAMRKGCYVAVYLYVEGEDAPAHDFSQTAADAARKLADAAAAQHARPAAAAAIATAWLKGAQPGLTVTVKKVEALEGPPDD